MLSDRCSGPPPPGGLLVYLKAKHMQGLPFKPQEKRGTCTCYNFICKWVRSGSCYLFKAWFDAVSIVMTNIVSCGAAWLLD